MRRTDGGGVPLIICRGQPDVMTLVDARLRQVYGAGPAGTVGPVDEPGDAPAHRLDHCPVVPVGREYLGAGRVGGDERDWHVEPAAGRQDQLAGLVSRRHGGRIVQMLQRRQDAADAGPQLRDVIGIAEELRWPSVPDTGDVLQGDVAEPTDVAAARHQQVRFNEVPRLAQVGRVEARVFDAHAVQVDLHGISVQVHRTREDQDHR
jgi:hypothetical protein